MPAQISRREALQHGVAIGIGAAVMSTASTRADQPKISMAFIGVGARGTVLLREVLRHPEVQIRALCDIDEKNHTRALDIVEKSRGRRPEAYLKGPEDYKRLLSRTDMKCVLIATPQELHATMTLDSFSAGKFVGCVVPACCTIDECWAIVRGQRKSGV